MKFSWWKHKNYHNLGDELAQIMIKKITGQTVTHSPSLYEADGIGVGSILDAALNSPKRQKPLHVFGCGLMKPIFVKQRDDIIIHSVRGELTRSILKCAGYDVARIGDIGLIVDQFLTSKPAIIPNKISFIPHHHFIDRYQDKLTTLGYNVIDLRTDNLELVLNEIASSSLVISQSLHGLIMSDSLNIPNTWLDAESLHPGDGFKFLDYFSSIARPSHLKIADISTDLETIKHNAHSYFDHVNHAKEDVLAWVQESPELMKLDKQPQLKIDSKWQSESLQAIWDEAILQENINIDFAFQLMTIAHSKHPNGPAIKAKLANYAVLLGNK